MYKRAWFLLVIGLFVLTGVSAQEDLSTETELSVPSDGSKETDTSIPESGKIYRVERFFYSVRGTTREKAIGRHLNIPEEGLSFASYEAMIAFVERKYQDLINYRVFE